MQLVTNLETFKGNYSFVLTAMLTTLIKYRKIVLEWNQNYLNLFNQKKLILIKICIAVVFLELFLLNIIVRFILACFVQFIVQNIKNNLTFTKWGSISDS